ncbi:hypothetical protein MLD38_037643 [Melastoma candidum]|uniref:Uncharacterized protein n=1 Tax=Melastoma candidum TaxID=119954 RepID=A0ACB9LNM8_9MYRT|nr:hypothetical protein MLD38_037643 [Melastoma candidum]
MDLNKAYALFVLLFIASFLQSHQLRPLEDEVLTTSGKVIDCVDIFKQPALDHPLLKDHKIQRAGIELVRNRYYGEHYYGAKAVINIWSPECKGDQFSASVIRLASGPETGDTNGIYIGWAVSPAVYGDDNAHLFTFWKGEGSTGCYDIRCPGFIQTDKGIVLGDVFNRTSDYGGIQQQVDVHITQDPITKNWILSFGIGNEERQAGYWPKELFPQMAGGAANLSFGGITVHGQGTSPPMGSGYKPDRDERHSAFMNKIMFSGNYSEFRAPFDYEIDEVLDNKNCYGLNNLGMTDNFGYFVLFGGPGGPNC